MLRILFLLITLHFFISLFAKEPEKYLLDYKHKYTYTKDSLERLYASKKIPKSVLKVNNAVHMYEISYLGKWIDGSFIEAKGVIFLPQSDSEKAEMVYCHGTEISVVPEYGVNDPEQLIALFHAADNYVAYFPFYYGLGGGEKEHIYQHTKTEGYSVIYMIKAAREFLKEKSIKTNKQLFITGYSQGGHATLAAHKMIESDEFPEIDITASSPMSGAYDMVEIQSEVMFRYHARPFYLPYLLISYDYAYDDIWQGDIYNIFKPKYRERIRKHFKQPRTVSYDTLKSYMPNIASKMLVDSVIENFDPKSSSILNKRLHENSLYDWASKAPIQFCACYGDKGVRIENSILAYEAMQNNGSEVYKKFFGKHIDHVQCAPFASLITKNFFDNIRSGKKRISKVHFPKRFLLNLAIMKTNREGKKKSSK